jgi:adenosylmethionine-8-amino-7-oxononanoate aminotransferase
MTTNAEWQRRSLASLWHPCTQMQRAAAVPPLPMVRGQGPWLFDAEGHRYFDALSSWWVNLFGHADARIAAAIKDQLDTLPHVMLAGCTHAPAVELAERLGARTGGALGHAFFASDGASAVEIALKMSFHFWRNVGRADKGEFVCVKQGYHGETLGALAVTDVKVFRDAYDPLLLRAHQVASPDARQAGPGERAADVAARAVAEVEALFKARADRIAAGMAMHDVSYLRALRALCTQYQVHLIADEIAVGCGRTGTFFASEQALPQDATDAQRRAAWPDFITLSKGISGGFLPLSLVLSTDAVYAAFLDEDVARGFLHSHSYTGNALACRAALAVLDRFDQEDVLARNAAQAQVLSQALEPLFKKPCVEHPRRCGMIWAFDVKAEHAGGNFAERFHLAGRRHELLIRPIGRTVYLMPPYVLDETLSPWLAQQVEATLRDVLDQPDADRTPQPPTA